MPPEENKEAKEDEQEDDAEALAAQNETKSACRKVCYAVPSRATVRARVRATTLLSNETEQFETGRHLNLSGLPSFIDTSFPALRLPSSQLPRATVRDGARARATTLWRKENKQFQRGRHGKFPGWKRLLPFALQRCKVAT